MGKKSRRRKKTKLGRNDPCPCGSGLKYKRCCEGKPGVVAGPLPTTIDGLLGLMEPMIALAVSTQVTDALQSEDVEEVNALFEGIHALFEAGGPLGSLRLDPQAMHDFFEGETQDGFTVEGIALRAHHALVDARVLERFVRACLSAVADDSLAREQRIAAGLAALTTLMVTDWQSGPTPAVEVWLKVQIRVAAAERVQMGGLLEEVVAQAEGAPLGRIRELLQQSPEFQELTRLVEGSPRLQAELSRGREELTHRWAQRIQAGECPVFLTISEYIRLLLPVILALEAGRPTDEAAATIFPLLNDPDFFAPMLARLEYWMEDEDLEEDLRKSMGVLYSVLSVDGPSLLLLALPSLHEVVLGSEDEEEDALSEAVFATQPPSRQAVEALAVLLKARERPNDARLLREVVELLA